MAKITLATVKSFVNKNRANLCIKVKSKFDGMTDCVQQVEDGFDPVCEAERVSAYNLGIQGAWFVGQSRDYFSEYNEGGYKGIKVYNCCGSFILAVKV